MSGDDVLLTEELFGSLRKALAGEDDEAARIAVVHLGELIVTSLVRLTLAVEGLNEATQRLADPHDGLRASLTAIEMSARGR